VKKHSLAQLLTTEPNHEAKPSISAYGRFSKRIRLPRGPATIEKAQADNATLDSDPAMAAYLRRIGNRRDNEGHVPRGTYWKVHAAAKAFLAFPDIQLTNHACSDLVAFKTHNPSNRDVERAVDAFAEAGTSIIAQHNQASSVLGLFDANHATLATSVNTHFKPKEKACSRDTFFAIYEQSSEEIKDMLQWGVYYPQRATAQNKILLADFKRFGNYGVAWVKPHSEDYENKTKTEHLAVIPWDFFAKVKARAAEAGRTVPFPNYRSLYKYHLTPSARQQFGEKLVSNRTRKLFESLWNQAHARPDIGAFLMGDNTKLAQTGHLPNIYNGDLDERELTLLIEEFQKADPYLNLENKGSPALSQLQINEYEKRIRELEDRIVKLTDRLAERA